MADAPHSDTQDTDTLALTLTFAAPMEEVVLAMWRLFKQRVKSLPKTDARMDPAPRDGVQCLNLPLELADWPEGTEDWFVNRWRQWMAHHSWVVAASELLWRWVSTGGGGEIRGSWRLVPHSSKDHHTVLHAVARWSLPSVPPEQAQWLEAALQTHLQNEQKAIAALLSTPRKPLPRY